MLRSKSAASGSSSASKPRSDAEPFYASKNMWLAGLQTTLNVLKDVVGIAAIPGLQEGVKGLLVVCETVQKTSQNSEDMDSLSDRIKDLTVMLMPYKNGEKPILKSMQERIDRMTVIWQKSGEKVVPIRSKNYAKRLISRDDDARVVTGAKEAINSSIQNFIFETNLAIEYTLDDLSSTMKPSAMRIESEIGYVRQDVQKIRRGQEALPRADEAQFDYGNLRKPCLEGTRVDILKLIYQWVANHSTTLSSETSPVTQPIFWLNGPGSAGTGKTTIAFTVSINLYRRGLLGASFFCSRTGDCSNPQMIFPTIAYQLGIFYPPFKEAVDAVLWADPSVKHSNLLRQLEKLLVEPLESLRGKMPFCVVILDALDECRNDGATSDILSALAQFIIRLSPLQFLVASRPDRHITQAFKLEEALKLSTKRCILHHVERPAVAQDISVFLKASLRLVDPREYNLDDTWPPADAVEALVKQSSGLFIFAATAVKFILDPSYANPERQLAKLIDTTTPTDSSSHQLLDRLYLQVLQTAFPVVSPELLSSLKAVLGSIALAYDQLSQSHLEKMLNVPVPVPHILGSLESILIVPQGRHDPISLIHKSFQDFLIDPSRCTDQNFLVKPQLHHALWAAACFQSMEALRPNPCDIVETWKLHHEHGETFPDLILAKIPPDLQYGCRYWSQHLKESMLSGQLPAALEGFCKTSFLFWLESCCLLGTAYDALTAVTIVQQSLSTSDAAPETCVDLLHDLKRVGQLFFSLLNTAACHIYISMPAFIPTQSSLLSFYSPQFGRAVKLLPEQSRTQHWDACLSVIEVHRDQVLSAVFSPSGEYIVSGDLRGKLHFWDSTGKYSKGVDGHNDRVTSLAYSNDGDFVLSGSADSTVKMWKAVTGELLYTIEVHRAVECTSAVFAHDGSFIASAYDDCKIRLWKPWDSTAQLHGQTLIYEGRQPFIIHSISCSPDNRCIASGSELGISLWFYAPGFWRHQISLEFKEHSRGVRTVAFSHCGSKLVSGSSKDFAVRIWDVKTATQIRKLSGHLSFVTSVRFSPDDKRVLSASGDKTIRIWDSRTGKQLKAFVGHSDFVSSATFSSAGTQIVSASCDGTLRIWDALAESNDISSGKCDRITLLTTSPDGTRFATATEKCIIQIYDAPTGHQLFALKKHTGAIHSLDFSSNRQYLASGSSDATVRIWSMSNGSCHKVLSSQTGIVRSVRFLPDNISIVAGSLDGSVRVWNVQTGKQSHLLQGHADEVLDVAVSPDGKYIASASKDKTVHIWDAAQRNMLQTLRGHEGNGSVTAVAFSPNSEFLASSSIDYTCLSDVKTGSLIQTFDFGCPDSTRLLFSADQQYIIMGSRCLPTRLPLFTQPPATQFSYSTCAKYYMNDGWIFHVGSQRRVCWVPQSHRGMMVACNNGVALTTSIADKVVVLDFTALEMWGEISG